MQARFAVRLALFVAVAACRSASGPAPHATVEVHVDPQVELVSIVEWLAGAPEYQTAPNTKYFGDMRATFKPYASHPVVEAARKLRAEHGIAFDAPMALAVALDDQLRLRAPPDDARFSGVELEPFLAALRDFAAQSKFAEFAKAHHEYFVRVADRLRAAITRENPQAWFDRFFGGQAGSRFTVIPGLLTGTWNYGPHVAAERYQIIGLARPDFDDLPTVDDATLELVVHEMAHSFVNPIFAAHRDELAASGARLYARVAETMTKQAYTAWEIFMNEQAVRAITTLYTRERRGAAAADAEIAREEARGFLWTRGLADQLAKKRGTFASAMPDVVRFFASAP